MAALDTETIQRLLNNTPGLGSSVLRQGLAAAASGDGDESSSDRHSAKDMCTLDRHVKPGFPDNFDRKIAASTLDRRPHGGGHSTLDRGYGHSRQTRTLDRGFCTSGGGGGGGTVNRNFMPSSGGISAPPNKSAAISGVSDLSIEGACGAGSPVVDRHPGQNPSTGFSITDRTSGTESKGTINWR